MPDSVALQPFESKVLILFESFPLKMTTSRLLAGLPSSKKTRSDTPLISESGGPALRKFDREYVPFPLTRLVTSVRYAVEWSMAQPLLKPTPMFTPVTPVPLNVTAAFPSAESLLGPCQKR
jgi:hypothetical protein